ncbi:MAG: DNA-formamidopyrimidine glycosylase family protein, partial [Pseudomonadota bacterium]
RMPELPDIEAYLTALEPRIEGETLEGIRLNNPFLLRTVKPSPQDASGRTVSALRRVGKRIAIGLEGDVWIVLHLMIAGRLHWKSAGAKLSGRRDLAAFDFADGSLTLTEAGTKRRASLHLVYGGDGLDALDPGGLEPLDADLSAFREALLRENHTVKRALTDPRLFSGIGNAYSDEILHSAGLSPVSRCRSLSEEESERLFAATHETLTTWRDRLCVEAKENFPEKVTAFRPEMAVHGRYGKPCPACGTEIQRIRYASNETNYCPRCQTEGRVLADRSLSRLLKGDWPRTIEELERP